MILELGADRRAENNPPSTEVCEQRLVKHKHRVLLMIPHTFAGDPTFAGNPQNKSMFVPDEPKKERKNLSKFPLL